MSNPSCTPNKLPRGIYFEGARQRYRVRLYWDHQVEHQSYHRDFTEAVEELRRARARIFGLRNSHPEGRGTPQLHTANDQIAALQSGLI